MASRYVELKKKFLSENTNFIEINPSENSAASLGNLQGITSDDEVWLVQCPKTVDLIELTDQKIKLPGKSCHDELETLAVEFTEPKDLAFGFQGKKKNYLKILPIQGSLIVRERLRLIKTENDCISGRTERVPVPQDLKDRHPLLGIDYKQKLQLDETILKRLEVSKTTKATKKIQKAQQIIDIKSESDDDEVSFVEETRVEKPIKRKRKRETDSETDVSCRKSKKHNKTSDDDSLQWIKNI